MCQKIFLSRCLGGHIIDDGHKILLTVFEYFQWSSTQAEYCVCCGLLFVEMTLNIMLKRKNSGTDGTLEEVGCDPGFNKGGIVFKSNHSFWRK